jgi:hypothetical protein
MDPGLMAVPWTGFVYSEADSLIRDVGPLLELTLTYNIKTLI